MRRVLPILLLLSPTALQAQSSAKAELLAGLYGETLGAAAACPAAITPARLDAAADLAAKHLKKVAGSADAADRSAKDLASGIARGRRDIEQGSLTCAQAESEFANLEHDLSP